MADEPVVTQTEPVKTEPAKVEPAKVEPKVEPVKAEPAKAEPVKAEPGVDPATKDSPLGKEPPVKYEFKLPEGVTLDQAGMAQFQEQATKLALKPEAAQGLVDFHFDQMRKAAESFTAAQSKAWETTIAGWKADIEKDPVLGAKGAEVQARVGKMLDEFGSKEAREAFDLTGAGWNPHVIRFIDNMAQALTEGGAVVHGRPVSKPDVTLGARLYGKGQ